MCEALVGIAIGPVWARDDVDLSGVAAIGLLLAARGLK